MERPKVKVVDVRGHSVFSELGDGTWQVEVAALGLTTTTVRSGSGSTRRGSPPW